MPEGQMGKGNDYFPAIIFLIRAKGGKGWQLTGIKLQNVYYRLNMSLL